MEKLVRPCPLLLKEREKRRERQVTAATVADRTKSSNEGFVQKMEALHASKAVHFLEAVSVALRRRMLQIRDVFRDVHAGQGGAISESNLYLSLRRFTADRNLNLQRRYLRGSSEGVPVQGKDTACLPRGLWCRAFHVSRVASSNLNASAQDTPGCMSVPGCQTE